MQDLFLTDHPRLFISNRDIEFLRNQGHVTPLFETLGGCLQEFCDKHVPYAPVSYDSTVHNSLLNRARIAQKIILSCIVEWFISGEKKYRDAVFDYIREMDGWEFWAWQAERSGVREKDAIFDLSYGENCLTLALVYDLLYAELEVAEKTLLENLALSWSVASGRRHCNHQENGGAFWYAKKDSNWNAVCAGGFGMLLLAFFEQIEDAEELLSRVDVSIRAFYDYLDETAGGWPEGLGYWNYGMRYGFMYLLAWENSRACKHQCLERESVRHTLSFPVDFCPNGCPIGFGDVNSWLPLPFHIRIASRMHLPVVMDYFMAELEKGRDREHDTLWPYNALLMCFMQDLVKFNSCTETITQNEVKLYEGMGWGILADDWCRPGFVISVRGGSTDVPHSHADLMSFHCVLGDEPMIVNLSPGKYLDTTFSPRRYDIFELRADSKNTVFVNGVSFPPRAKLDSTRRVKVGTYEGIRLIGTECIGKMGEHGMNFLGRLFLKLNNDMFLIVDRCDPPGFGNFETRFHSYAEPRLTDSASLCLQGERETLFMSFAATSPCVLSTSLTSPTLTCDRQAKVIRFTSVDRTCKDVITACLVSRFSGKVDLAYSGGQIKVTGKMNGNIIGICLDLELC